MEMLSESQRAFLWEATTRYRESFPESPAEECLEDRGLSQARIREYGLGYVADPLPGHEMYRGFLSIPYMRYSTWRGWSVATIRFRCLEDHDHRGHGKYMSPPGDRPRMYNTLALSDSGPRIGISEGEIDAITASINGLPTVGIPGATSWDKCWREPFLGFKDVFVFADGDEPGLKFANGIARQLPNARVVPCPPGEDINSLVNTRGKEALDERIK